VSIAAPAVDSGSIEKALAALFEEAVDQAAGGPPITRACRLNLVIGCRGRDQARQAEAAVAAIAEECPSRALLAVIDDRAGDAVTAEVTAHCAPGDGEGRHVCCEQVTITGSGWQPGETVMLNLVESPNLDTHPPLTAIADASGNIFNNQFSPDTHDLNVRFYLTAVGASSQAQNTFTDGQPIITTVASSPFSPNQSSSAGVNDTTDITGKNQGGGAIADFRIRIRAGSTSGTLA